MKSQAKETRTKPTREGPRRGKAVAMHVVAAVRALWLRGHEKCPFEFATVGGPRAVVWVVEA